MWAVDGQVWLEVHEPTGVYIYHHDGQDWFGGTAIDYLVGVEDVPAMAWVDVGSDGTVWVGLRGPSEGASYSTRLARFDGNEWAEWGRMVEGFAVEVAPDGSLWAIPSSIRPTSCNGIAHFDGATWAEYLEGHCVRDIDVAPDGTVWSQARKEAASGGWDEGGVDETYVIRPGQAAPSGQ